jgi:hypothetical protein
MMFISELKIFYKVTENDVESITLRSIISLSVLRLNLARASPSECDVKSLLTTPTQVRGGFYRKTPWANSTVY